ncbi:MAG: single-stranded DNA-binding protein [Planctomycetota bacterium]
MDFNKVLLIGNLTRDPEMRYSGSGAGICKFGVAVNRKYRKQDGDMQEETTFVDIVVFGRQAETCNEYLKKGSGALIEGRLNYESWQAQDGSKRNKLSVVGERVQFMPRGGGGGGGGRGDYGGGAQQHSMEPPSSGGESFDDDVPF